MNLGSQLNVRDGNRSMRYRVGRKKAREYLQVNMAEEGVAIMNFADIWL